MKKSIDLTFWSALLLVTVSSRHPIELLALAPSAAILGSFLIFAVRQLRKLFSKTTVNIWIFFVLMLMARAVGGLFGTSPYWTAALLILMLPEERGAGVSAQTRFFHWGVAATFFAGCLAVLAIYFQWNWPVRPSFLMALLAVWAGCWEGLVERKLPFLKRGTA